MIGDMPMEALESYQGRNPKPADHAAYWEAALREQRATEPDARLEPVDFPCNYADCFYLTFTGVGGARIHAKFLRPKAIQKPCPALLFFHGYGASSGDWVCHLPYVAQGFCVAAMDVRGQGGCSMDSGGVPGYTLHGHIIRGLDGAPEDLFYRSVFLDTVQLFRVICEMPEVDEARIGAKGGSQGGGLAIACAALNPTLNRVCISYPFLCDYLRVWEMGAEGSAYGELVEYFRRFDPRHLRHQEVFYRLGYIDCQHLAPMIRARVLFQTCMMDNACPPSTQYAAYNKITAEKEHIIFHDFVHEMPIESEDISFRFFSNM